MDTDYEKEIELKVAALLERLKGQPIHVQIDYLDNLSRKARERVGDQGNQIPEAKLMIFEGVVAQVKNNLL